MANNLANVHDAELPCLFQDHIVLTMKIGKERGRILTRRAQSVSLRYRIY